MSPRDTLINELLALLKKHPDAGIFAAVAVNRGQDFFVHEFTDYLSIENLAAIADVALQKAVTVGATMKHAPDCTYLARIAAARQALGMTILDSAAGPNATGGATIQ